MKTNGQVAQDAGKEAWIKKYGQRHRMPMAICFTGYEDLWEVIAQAVLEHAKLVESERVRELEWLLKYISDILPKTEHCTHHLINKALKSPTLEKAESTTDEGKV